MAKAKWQKKTLRLRKDHQWEGKPGNKVFVANRGDVRFEFPGSWLVIPGEDSIKFYNKKPPDDDCILQLSVLHLPPEIDWSGYPVAKLLNDVTKDDERGSISRGEIKRELRQNFELAWLQTSFIDPNEQREARGRSCLVRGGTVQAFLTLDYWPEHADWVEPVWDEVLSTLRIGQYIKDIRTGARYGYG